MNTRERFVRTLTGQPVDRVPFMRCFGGTNWAQQQWIASHPEIEGNVDRILGVEGTYRGWAITGVNFGFARCGHAKKLAEAAGQITWRQTEGTVIVTNEGSDYHSCVIEWPVKNRQDWLRVKEEHLALDDPSRFPADWDAKVKEYGARDYPLQLTHGGVYGFLRNLMGDVNLSYAFYDEPALVHEMLEHYTEVVLRLWTKMTTAVEFDLVEFWEDMASKNGSIISPATFREFIAPQYRRVAAFARTNNVPIILTDSDGFTEDLAGWMMESGLTAMYPFEVGAGNDLPRARARYPTLGIIAGLEKAAAAEGPAAVDREMRKAREMIKRGRFIPGPDHMPLSNVSWEQYRYFMERLKDVVMSTPPENC